MFLERGKKKTGKGKVVSNAQNSVLRGLGKVMGILFSFSFSFFSFFFFFFGKGKKNQRGQISACLGKCIWKMEDKERMVKSKKYL